jgi:copper chaperone
MTTTTYAVTGMSCEHCVNAVTSELTGLGGVSAVTVDLMPGGLVSPSSADGLPGERLAETPRTRFVDENLQLIRAHLHPLAEIIGDDDPPLRRGVLVDEYFRAATIALAAQQGEPGKTPGIVIHFRAPFGHLPQVEHYAPPGISQRENRN